MRAILGSVLAVGGISVAAPDADAVAYTPGAPGVGDPYFPKLGNGGFEIDHYDLDLGYVPSTHMLSGTVTISATATQNLSRFDLDLSGMTVHAVTVDGADATFARIGDELRITPRHGLANASGFTVAVTYDGQPQTIRHSPIVFGSDYGWQYTPDGAFVGDEPNAAHTWFPGNDHPGDKASYTIKVTVPQTRQVISNGELTSSTTQHGRTTYVWDETRPMATYLVTLGIGRFDVHNGSTPAGIPETVAYAPVLAADVAKQHVFQRTGAITDYWAEKFGPYPFTSTGAIIDNVPDVGFSLETQTRPLYGFVPDPGTMSHELAHQWFGDSVSVHSWRDIWLNEGFATFAMWLWAEHTGGPDTFRNAREVYAEIHPGDPFWKQAISDPGRNGMFSGAVYARGGMTLAALRHLIGDADFFTLLRQWTQQRQYATGSTTQFRQLAEQVSGRDLDTFFRIWLQDKKKPASFTAH